MNQDVVTSHKSAGRRGFSRTEMLVVGATAFVGVLALPAMSQSLGEWFGISGKAQSNSTCQNNLKEMGLAIAQYTQDYDEKFPLIASSRGNGSYGWAEIVDPYLKNRKAFSCPQDRHAQANDPTKPRYTDYWYNRTFNNLPMAAVEYPARSLTVGDGDGNSPQSNARYNLSSLPKSWKTIQGSPATRHNKRANYLFADGHVDQFLPTQIYTASPIKNKSLPATFAAR